MIWLPPRQPKLAAEAAWGRQISHNPIARNAAKPTRASLDIPIPDPAPATSCGAVCAPGTRHPRRRRAGRGSMVREREGALHRQRLMSPRRRSREAQREKPEQNGSSSSQSNTVEHRRSIAARVLLPAAQFARQVYDPQTTGEQREARRLGNGSWDTGKGRRGRGAGREKRDERNRNKTAHHYLHRTRLIAPRVERPCCLAST